MTPYRTRRWAIQPSGETAAPSQAALSEPEPPDVSSTSTSPRRVLQGVLQGGGPVEDEDGRRPLQDRQVPEQGARLQIAVVLLLDGTDEEHRDEQAVLQDAHHHVRDVHAQGHPEHRPERVTVPAKGDA